jgi:hypothetical protein
LGQFQIWLLSAGQLLLAVFVALFFLVNQSNLCHNIGQDSVCRVDEGGMMAIAAAILWGIGSLLTVHFIRSPEKKRQELVEALAEDLANKIRKKAVEKQKRREQKEQQEAALAASFHDEAVDAVATHPKVKQLAMFHVNCKHVVERSRPWSPDTKQARQGSATLDCKSFKYRNWSLYSFIPPLHPHYLDQCC